MSKGPITGQSLQEWVYNQPKDPAAVALGRKAKGVKKTLTQAERARRRQRAQYARSFRGLQFDTKQAHQLTQDAS